MRKSEQDSIIGSLIYALCASLGIAAYYPHDSGSLLSVAVDGHTICINLHTEPELYTTYAFRMPP
jgi:hypothetical protein